MKYLICVSLIHESFMYIGRVVFGRSMERKHCATYCWIQVDVVF